MANTKAPHKANTKAKEMALPKAPPMAPPEAEQPAAPVITSGGIFAYTMHLPADAFALFNLAKFSGLEKDG